MELQFEKLAKQILGEGIGEEGAGASASAAHERHKAEQQSYAANRSYVPRSRPGGYGDPSAKTAGEQIFFTKGQRNKVWNAAKSSGIRGFQLSDNYIWVPYGKGTDLKKVLDAAGIQGLSNPEYTR